VTYGIAYDSKRPIQIPAGCDDVSGSLTGGAAFSTTNASAPAILTLRYLIYGDRIQTLHILEDRLESGSKVNQPQHDSLNDRLSSIGSLQLPLHGVDIELNRFFRNI
jgi:hypothetical protein